MNTVKVVSTLCFLYVLHFLPSSLLSRQQGQLSDAQPNGCSFSLPEFSAVLVLLAYLLGTSNLLGSILFSFCPGNFSTTLAG